MSLRWMTEQVWQVQPSSERTKMWLKLFWNQNEEKLTLVVLFERSSELDESWLDALLDESWLDESWLDESWAWWVLAGCRVSAGCIADSVDLTVFFGRKATWTESVQLPGSSHSLESSEEDFLDLEVTAFAKIQMRIIRFTIDYSRKLIIKILSYDRPCQSLVTS